ncbi:UNVERIFIED_ORG: hypothetical protein E4P37_19735 [Bacillus sp. AZ43]
MRGALRGLDPRNAEKVAAHLVAAGTLVDDDPVAALAHARAARDRASRVAAVREAVGVAAYHAEDYAEAARELRAYRRMSGDESYRAVLADCERALGRPEVALRLVSEALAQSPDAEEIAELRLVEAGARRDLGEHDAARVVLEAALGGRPRPADLAVGDPIRLRFAAAYADLLEERGEQALAEEWRAAVAEADPETLAEEVVFTELDLDEEPDAPAETADVPTSGWTAEDDELLSGDEPGDDTPEQPDGDFPTSGRELQDEIEAEVAELLGETGPPAGADDTH